jgi:hypothetical protein
MKILGKLINIINSLRYYVVADPSDNSITLSKKLFYHIKKHSASDSDTSVFVFRIPQHNTFGFMLNPDIEEQTQLCQIQYNGKYKCVGFETLCPSVGYILFNYGLPALHKVKMSVSLHKTPQGRLYYQFDAPKKIRHEEHIRKQDKEA